MAEIVGVVIGVATIASELYTASRRPFDLVAFYGFRGLPLYIFGNRAVWRTEAHILGRLDDADAMNFKKSVQDECTMVSVAAAIMAQISITTLSLENLSQTHWVARAFFLFSLVSSLMAVYYATTQHRIMGRLGKPAQVRGWIRGRVLLQAPPTRRPQEEPHDLTQRLEWRRTRPARETRSDPGTFEPVSTSEADIITEVIAQCFTPSIASVLTISAPQMLLSSSLLSLFLGIGVYYGFIWTRNLDVAALGGQSDSKNIVIVYIISTTMCWLIYSISRLISDSGDNESARGVVLKSFRYYIRDHPDVERAWFANNGARQEGHHEANA